MSGEPILTPAQERTISQVLDKVRRVKPRLKMLEALGRADEQLNTAVQQIEQSCVGAIELNEMAKMGEV